MQKRLLYAAAVVILLILLGLVVWQGSFNMGKFGPASASEVYLFLAMSTLVFLLMVFMGFMLFRVLVKLYIERRQHREGSHIKTKLVVGSLVLSILPVLFMVLWSVQVLNLNLKSWFSRPAENIKLELRDIGDSINREGATRARAQAEWFAGLPEIALYASGGKPDLDYFERLCDDNDIGEVWIENVQGKRHQVCVLDRRGRASTATKVTTAAKIASGGRLLLNNFLPVDLAAKEREIAHEVAEYDQLAVDRRETRNFYLTYLALITLFILFAGTWIALFLSKQITEPIAALLDAATEVRRGNLHYRIKSGAIDEFVTLIRAFNEMMQDLESSSRELDSRRRFIERILESIPTGLLSVTSDGRIQTVNRAMMQMMGGDSAGGATRLDELFAPDEASEFRYLMNRARRTGIAARQLDLELGGRSLHLAITVAPIDQRFSSGYVIVLEDISELLRAQKSAAWNEVARRIAHEIKNPLTPISLSAERISRLLDRTVTPPEFARIVRESTGIIASEVESVKSLIDEFTQFSRFPAAQPQPSDLNEIVENAMGVFAGRLEGITARLHLSPHLPPVSIDREQFKRVVVNLVDNAAEAMQERALRNLSISTHAPTPELVELVIADTGCGISQDDKEKLFLPYFSTKGRGTGLGLAIVNHILMEHRAQIRVEDNQPAGARFTIEIPAMAVTEFATKETGIEA